MGPGVTYSYVVIDGSHAVAVVVDTADRKTLRRCALKREGIDHCRHFVAKMSREHKECYV